jgi:hypothetical protein
MSEKWNDRPVYTNQALRKMCQIGEDNFEFLHALAHNKEMHSLHGNILFQSGAFESREAVAGKAAMLMWEKNTVVASGTEEPLRLLEDAAVQQSVIQIMNYETMVWQTPTENGTCHQVLLDWEGMYTIWAEANVDPLGGIPEGVGIEERGQRQAMMDTLEMVHGLRTRRARRRVEGVARLDVMQKRSIEALVREELRSIRNEVLEGRFVYYGLELV